jgi:hypothetical protein
MVGVSVKGIYSLVTGVYILVDTEVNCKDPIGRPQGARLFSLRLAAWPARSCMGHITITDSDWLPINFCRPYHAYNRRTNITTDVIGKPCQVLKPLV